MSEEVSMKDYGYNEPIPDLASYAGASNRKIHGLVDEKKDVEIYDSTPHKATKITLVPDAISIIKGAMYKFNVEVEPSMANIPELCFESSDPSIVSTVDDMICANKAGEVTIVATSVLDNSITASATVIVYENQAPTSSSSDNSGEADGSELNG